MICATSVSAIRSRGGDVKISFGGASGIELAQACTSVSALTAEYQALDSGPASPRTENTGRDIPGRVFGRDHRRSLHLSHSEPGGVWTSLPCELMPAEGASVTIRQKP